jgi:hypothetical protein
LPWRFLLVMGGNLIIEFVPYDLFCSKIAANTIYETM